MLGNLGQLAGFLKSARDLQTQMAKLQEDLAHRRYTAEAGGGLVGATVDGRGTILSVKIEPKAVEDRELLEDLIAAAVNAAVTKSQEAVKAEMAALTGGLQIPGLTDLLGGGQK